MEKKNYFYSIIIIFLFFLIYFLAGIYGYIDYTRFKPYLFSNSVAPVIVSASLEVLKIINKSKHLIKKLNENTLFFRDEIKKIGLKIKDGVHPIVPIMIGDAKKAQIMSKKLLEENIYVIGFSFPVVPKNEARIRVQISAAHNKEDLNKAVQAFHKIGKELNLI